MFNNLEKNCKDTEKIEIQNCSKHFNYCDGKYKNNTHVVCHISFDMDFVHKSIFSLFPGYPKAARG